MGKKITVTTVTLAEGPLFHDYNEDGQFTTFNISVAIPSDTNPNIMYIHVHTFREWERVKAASLAANVLTAKVVDVENGHWTEYDMGNEPTLEEKLGEFGLEWQREQEERNGFIH